MNKPLQPSASTAPKRPSGFSFAFQPIVDIRERLAISHEALVRGPAGQPAGSVFERYSGEQFDALDAACREDALALASRMGITTDLNLNFSPRLTNDAEFGLDKTVDAAHRLGFPLHRLVLEATEGDTIANPKAFARAANEYRRLGLQLAIDDFGAGYAGLNLLAEFQPDFLKLDMLLVRDIHTSGPRQAIVRAIMQVCEDLGVELVAEGVETLDEFRWFEDAGVRLFQGYLFAKPAFERLPALSLPPPLVGA